MFFRKFSRQRGSASARSMAALIALWVLLVPINALGVELAKRPLVFVDESGAEIESYCVAPIYYKAHGVGLGVEASGRSSSEESYLMWPAYIGKEDGFFEKIKKKNVHGFVFWPLLLPVTWGESVGASGYLFFKKNYSPLLYKDSFDVRFSKKIQMNAGDSEPAIRLLLAKEPDQLALHKLFRVLIDIPLIVDYSDEDRELLRKCYYGEDATVTDSAIKPDLLDSFQ